MCRCPLFLVKTREFAGYIFQHFPLLHVRICSRFSLFRLLPQDHAAQETY